MKIYLDKIILIGSVAGFFGSNLAKALVNAGAKIATEFSLIPCLSLRGDPQGWDKSEKHSKVCLSPPCYLHMSQRQVNKGISIYLFNGS